jgi:hypothetical protein
MGSKQKRRMGSDDLVFSENISVDIVVIFVKYHINSLKMTFIVLTIPGSV